MNTEFQKRIRRKDSILTMEHPYERVALKWLSVALVSLICAYLYFVSASVLNVIARKDALRQTSDITSAIAALEQRYFTMSQEITRSSATGLGLGQVSATSYVYRPGNIGVVYSADEIKGLEI